MNTKLHQLRNHSLHAFFLDAFIAHFYIVFYISSGPQPTCFNDVNIPLVFYEYILNWARYRHYTSLKYQ